MRTELPRDALVSFLDGQIFTAAELCWAASIPANSLSNILNQTNLELCTKKPGRGRARTFCLQDCYSILLMDRLTKKLKDYSAASAAVNEFNFEVHRHLMLSGQSNYRYDYELKRALAESIYRSNAEYYERDLRAPYYFFEDEGKWRSNQDASYFKNMLWLAEDGIIVFNLTLLFRKFDFELGRHKGFPVDKHYGEPGMAELMKIMADALRPPKPTADSDD